MQSNTWAKDELILALDAYFNIRPRAPDKSMPEILELSDLLKSLPLHSHSIKADNFRSPASIVMKLMNFRSLDPEYAGKGLQSIGKLDREIWNEFSQKKDVLRKVAKTLKTLHLIKPQHYESLDEVEIYEAMEGKILTREHIYRERDSKIVAKKKESFLSKHGHISCEVCGFNFEKMYGERGKEFIECHHTIPLCDIDPGKPTKLSDLILVCSNCHRIIHRKRPWLSILDLKNLINKHASPSVHYQDV